MRPSDALASPCKASLFVTGNCEPLADHPVYGDEALVGQVTGALVEAGHTVFQLFMLDPDERTHSLMVLERVNVPPAARVLSLGCGVGGMERHWLDARPDLRLVLVNQSMAQLARNVCPGATLIQADMRSLDTNPPGLCDLVVMAYSLHHVEDVPAMIEAARSMVRPGGTLLVLDVYGGGYAFHEAVAYQSLDAGVLAACGLVRLDYEEGLQWHLQPASVITQDVRQTIMRDPVLPGMWVGMA